jgi:PAS domain S-box-containing protein
MLGYEVEEIEPHVRSCERLIHPDDLHHTKEVLADHLAGRTVIFETEHRMRHKSGAWIWVLNRGKVIERDADGKPLRAAGTHLNISKRNQAERALQRSESVLRATIESISDGLLVASESNRISHFNSQFLKIWSIPADLQCEKDDQVLIRHVAQKLLDSDQFKDRIRDIYGSSIMTEDSLLLKDGRTIERRSYPLALPDDEAGRVWLFRDVTERKAMEQSLRLFQYCIDNAPEFIHWLDDDGRLCYANDSMCRTLGYTKEEIKSLYLWEVDPYVGKERFLADLEAYKKKRQEKRGVFVETGHRRKDGTLLPVEVLTKHLWVGDTEMHLAFARDITERKQTMKALQASLEEKTALLQEIRRLNRLYAVLSQVNQVIVRADSREHLLSAICRIAVENGQFKTAWIGWMDSATGIVQRVAQWGDERGLLNRIEIRADEQAEGMGPTGTAIREGKVNVCNDLRNDCRMAPWLDVAVEAGARAVAAVPIRYQDKVCGALAVAAEDPHFFQEKEIALLEEVALDISFALDNLEKEAQRRRAETELRASEERYRALVNSMKDVVYSLSTDGRIQFIGPQILRYGHSPEELTSKSFLEIIHPEDQSSILRDFQHAVATGEARLSEFRIVCKDGTHAWFEELGQAVSNNRGQIVAVTGMLRDITERRSAEERIRDQAALLEAVHDAILLCHPDGMIHYMNPAAEEMTGWSLAEAQSRDLMSVLQPRSDLRPATQETLNRGEWNGEMVLSHRNGQTRVVDSRWTLVRQPDQSPSLLMVCNDITERKQLEQQYLRAQRLESIGTLASGVAHDLNNILSPIIMGLDLLEEGVQDPDTLGMLATMKQSAQRGKDTVSQLLTFARGTPSQKGPIPPRRLMKEIARLLEQTLPKNIEIYADYSEQPMTVLADASQLHQVLMNLCVNACDAMPEGGKLFLALEKRIFDESAARMHPKARPAAYVVFKVTDTGMGIPPEIQDHIFDPFFTTKPHGKGTGLGLATVLGIVEGHGGFILTDSRQGCGTTFSVYLPASTAPENSPSSQRPAAPRGNGEQVLIVDDEPAVLGLAESILERNGYEVVTAARTSEAIAQFERHKEIKAVLTDIMMPFGDGKQMVATLRRQAPALKIIAMSGLEESKQEILTRGADAFLRKPFNSEELLGLLHKLLQHPKAK